MAKQQYKPQHEHTFVLGPYCVCGCLALTSQDFALWCGEWDAYYSKVEGTRAYQNWKEMLQAVKDKNLKLVRLLRSEANTKILEDDFELKKPGTPDPRTLTFNGRCVIIDS